ncbi:sensor histidine kinase [Aureimonas sp. Leaf454]|uniref:TspO/MBR family protein n=1 Tax=Aureimonas sp. Leaf454 TaxID=1736381 RepID=UPI0006F3DB38|nr:TspO/MBR family protein [Aureimonas sp. Leaf454]KQT44531.1 sensor histidine kinase [Aureimonas sp. Leaf454]
MTASPARHWGLLVLFLVGVVGAGMLIGVNNPPGDWYAGLEKPWFTPPGILFPIAWTILYILIAIAGWRVFTRGLGRPKARWVVQMALNLSWSPVFFGAHLIGAGLAIILALLVAILLFIAETWRVDRPAALCFLPYAVWVAFAALLNGSIFLSN